jgi:Polyketide cyclase / dehydrase and lipid transport
MAVISNSVVIRCTPEQAFGYLSDLRNELEWNPACERMEKLTDGPIGPGTRFRAKWKLSSVVELEILEHDRPNGWTAHNGGPLEVTMTIRIDRVPDGTRLSTRFDARPHGFLRLIFPILLRKLRADEKANMGHIRTALERRHATDADTQRTPHE